MDLNCKDGVLWRVGRNLEGFQKLEATLKAILPALSVAGTLTQITEQIETQKHQVKKASLGNLASVYQKQVLTPSVPFEDPQLVTEPLFVFSSTVEAHPEILKAMKSRWKSLVRERNRLVHSDLIDYDLETSDGRIRLSEKLDAQYDRISALLSEVGGIQKGYALAMGIHQQFFESEELQGLLSSETNGS